MRVLVVENRRHSQNARGYDSQPQGNDGAQAVVPGDLHRSQGKADLEETQIGFIQRNGFDYLKVTFSPAALDDLAEELTVNLRPQNQGFFFLLSDTARVGMGDDIEVAIEKSDELSFRLTTQLLDLTLNSDLFLKVQNIVGVCVDCDNPWKTAGADGDANSAAFPEFTSRDFCWQFGSPVLSFFPGQPPTLSPHIAYRLQAALKEFLVLLLPCH